MQGMGNWYRLGVRRIMSSSNLYSVAHLFSVEGKSVEDLAAYKEIEQDAVIENGTYTSTPELEELQRLAGVHEIRNDHVKSMQDALAEQSKLAAERKRVEKEQNIQPGTQEWFKLWFGDAR